jgi:hypothetical protein
LAAKAATQKKEAKTSTKKSTYVAKASGSPHLKKSKEASSKSAKPAKGTPTLKASVKSNQRKKTSAIVAKSQEKALTKAAVENQEKKPVTKVNGASSTSASMKLGILQKQKPEKTSASKSSNFKSNNSKAPKKMLATQEGASDISLNSQNTKWLQYYKKYGNIEAVEYDMTRQFEEKKPILHPKLGWGFIVSIVNDRLEVLFQEGIKTLISNYNPDLKL